jgi:hypothetical protein
VAVQVVELRQEPGTGVDAGGQNGEGADGVGRAGVGVALDEAEEEEVLAVEGDGVVAVAVPFEVTGRDVEELGQQRLKGRARRASSGELGSAEPDQNR